MATGASKAKATPFLNGPGGGGYPVRRAGGRPKEDISFLDISGLVYPHDLGKYYLNIQISDYIRTTVFVGADRESRPRGINMNLKSNISLPIPTQMVDHHQVNYAEEDLGLIKGGLTTAETGGIDSYLTALGHTFSGVFGKGLDLVGFGALDQSQYGVTPNEFLTVLMKGPAYKKYSFSWKLSARTKEESETLRKIIATLNQNMAPKPFGAIWGYPSVFKCGIVPNERFMYGFKPAMLEDLQVNYTPNGMGAFTQGVNAPESIDLTLNFREIEFWGPEDFNP